jgi:hypothetical protein
MQTEGGYNYPSDQILIGLSALSVIVTAIMWYAVCLSLLKVAALFMALEGTALLASAYTPVGLVPPQGNLWQKCRWFFLPQNGTTVTFDPRMYFGGLLCLFISFVATFAA